MKIIIWTLFVMLTTFLITMNLGINESQIIITWIVVCIILQGALTAFIVFKTKQKIKREQSKSKEEE